MTFNDDGTCAVETRASPSPGRDEMDGDAVTVAHLENDQLCMGAEGVYTVAETDPDATFTTVEDPCEERATATAATWAKDAE